MILIISHPDDVHTRCVLRELKSLGRDGAVLDTALLGRGVRISQFAGSSSLVECATSGLCVTSDEIESVWLRRPGRFAMAGLVRDEYLDFVVREWRESFWGWLDHLAVRVVNPLVAQERATKLLQLKLAREVGLRIPHTCVTNDPAMFAAFVERYDGRVVHKAMTQIKSRLLYTKPWTPDDDEYISELELAPTLVQERIVGPADVRATIIGQDVFVARIATPEDVVDSRLVTDLPYEPWSLPDPVQRQLLDMMDRLGLSFGTVDLKVAQDGELVFLEVNPQGQFAYIEIATGMPLLRKFAELLAGAGCADP